MGLSPSWSRVGGFERVAGCGDALAVANEITSGDVLALTFLDIRTGLPELALAVLETHAERIAKLLEQIPGDVAMHEAEWLHFAPDSPATELWELLRTCAGADHWGDSQQVVGPEASSPAADLDRQVRGVLGRPRGFWLVCGVGSRLTAITLPRSRSCAPR
ncbi:hypothetical protein SAMN05661093_05101 [Kibdelosporangium aridum]|uniref:Uncharacterized protein n=1 Tax=Kibdelosporangium aridum TaxID=2030 RepID=A0A1W2EZS1_KIBAR|nr:hypothetical protein SAMN05661093_05101 [Kibdelosporangium aridum]